VDVVAVVLVIQPLGRELRQPVVVVARDQKRRRIEGVPTRLGIVGNRRLEDLGAPPQNVTRSWTRADNSAIRAAARSFAYEPMSRCYDRSPACEIPLFWNRQATSRRLRSRPMRPGARTQEELEMLLEDAFVMRNTEALTELFEDGALLVADHAEWEARGGDEIARWAREMWEHDHTYLADSPPGTPGARYRPGVHESWRQRRALRK
jgi:hypothetical protein